MDDDVERIDLVDDFHAHRPARMKPIRVIGTGTLHYPVPAELSRQIFDANVFVPTRKDRIAQAKFLNHPEIMGETRLIRFMKICEFGGGYGHMTDWYFRGK